MEKYKEIYITGFSKLKELIEVLNNDSNIKDYTVETESRGDSDDTHEYYIQVMYIQRHRAILHNYKYHINNYTTFTNNCDNRQLR